MSGTTGLNATKVILNQYANDRTYNYMHTVAYFQRFFEGLNFLIERNTMFSILISSTFFLFIYKNLENEI